MVSRSPSLSPSAEPSRAGSRPGEGRERPGRRRAPGDDPRDTADRERRHGRGEADARTRKPDVAGVGTFPDVPRREDGDAGTERPGRDGAASQAVPVPSAPSRAAVPDAAAGAERPVEPVLRILPLGSGLVLIGLGLGLAFVALRMRQGDGLR
ncbi:hypothetical protein [Streptomyces sp. NPDC007904]|jgi:hypothetical protein|uniref:hypothetical protein n=1 Tax=Streptomyces sp. NPDC007904 TaxID=3364787 RepID=UPI0036E6A24E